MNYQTLYDSPIGSLLLKANDYALTEISFYTEFSDGLFRNNILEKTMQQLDEYFARKRQMFEVPIQPHGTDFQKMVWQHLKSLSYGQQISYAHLSRQMKIPLSIRAIANANGKNPIPIIIPCHRVVGSKGELVGYSGGLWRKQFLLELEGNILFR